MNDPSDIVERPDLSIIIPARNEEKRLPDTLEKLKKFDELSPLKIEILVIDDGSEDKTPSLVKQYSPLVKLFLNKQNVGKGASVKRGVFLAKGKYIVFMDADLSVPLTFLQAMIDKLDLGADMVIGSRRTEGASIVVHQPLAREKLGQLFNFIIRILRLSEISDTQCGFKGFKQGVAENIFRRQRTGKFAFDIELIHIAHKLGYSVFELPVEWYNSAETKVKPLIDPFLMLVDVLKIRFNSWLGRYV